MKKKSNKKKFKVTFSKDFLNKFNDLPNNVTEKFEELILGFKTGKIDPTKIGKPINWVELDIKLKCPGCYSNNVEWLLDKNSNEVTFHCLKCSESFWMTLNEYNLAIKRNPDKIVYGS